MLDVFMRLMTEVHFITANIQPGTKKNNKNTIIAWHLVSKTGLEISIEPDSIFQCLGGVLT